MEKIKSILEKYEAIDLADMSSVKLMNRIDTKYILHENKIDAILTEARPFYQVLKVSGNPFRTYDSNYYDTANNEMYLHHQNGKLNRFKVRERYYSDTKDEFVEIKFKNNKGLTSKKRLAINKEPLAQKEDAFIMKNSIYSLNMLVKVLHNRFSRIMLVSNDLNERVTVDFDLQYFSGEQCISLPGLIIIEQKRTRINKQTVFSEILRNHRVSSTGFSKYCMGRVLTNNQLKFNRFKPKLLRMKKMNIEPKIDINYGAYKQ